VEDLDPDVSTETRLGVVVDERMERAAQLHEIRNAIAVHRRSEEERSSRAAAQRLRGALSVGNASNAVAAFRRGFSRLAQYEVCMVCAELKPGTEFDADKEYSSNDSCFEHFRDALLHGASKLCHACERDLSSSPAMPPLCFANGLCFGDIPPALQGLSDVERKCISLLDIVIKVNFTGQYASRGHAICYRNDVAEIARRLLRRPSDAGSHFFFCPLYIPAATKRLSF
jgi:hypothetical protein